MFAILKTAVSTPLSSDFSDQTSHGWHNGPTLHCAGKNAESDQRNERDQKDASKCSPIGDNGKVLTIEVGTKIARHKADWEEEHGCLGDEQRHPGKSLHVS